LHTYKIRSAETGDIITAGSALSEKHFDIVATPTA
jgi:hypothetical protein